MFLANNVSLKSKSTALYFSYKLKIIVAVFLTSASFYSTTIHAFETSLELQKGATDSSYGVNLSLASPFYRGSPFYWQVAYNRLDTVEGTIDVPEADNGIVTSDEFSLDTIDLALSYVYTPKTYNKSLNKLFVEFQAGVAVAISENKYQWANKTDPDQPYEEVLSSPGDINPLLAISVGYNLTQSTSIYLGVKSYPSYSEFDAITSVFLGFTYHFKPKRRY